MHLNPLACAIFTDILDLDTDLVFTLLAHTEGPYRYNVLDCDAMCGLTMTGPFSTNYHLC